ncbi:MAG: hypothetical protein PPP58_02720 [Natronomonas sp.]
MRVKSLVSHLSGESYHYECRRCGGNVDETCEECPDCGGDVVAYELS